MVAHYNLKDFFPSNQHENDLIMKAMVIYHKNTCQKAENMLFWITLTRISKIHFIQYDKQPMADLNSGFMAHAWLEFTTSRNGSERSTTELPQPVS